MKLSPLIKNKICQIDLSIYSKISNIYKRQHSALAVSTVATQHLQGWGFDSCPWLSVCGVFMFTPCLFVFPLSHSSFRSHSKGKKKITFPVCACPVMDLVYCDPCLLSYAPCSVGCREKRLIYK